jgi:PilZ domain
VPSPIDASSRVRLRAGRELAVINVSTTGALVEGTTRLLPGTHVDVHVTAAQGRVLVRARVVRCAVWTVTAEVIQYRGALAFTTPVDLPPGEVASQGEP